MTAAFRDGWICVQVAPPSGDRHTLVRTSPRRGSPSWTGRMPARRRAASTQSQGRVVELVQRSGAVGRVDGAVVDEVPRGAAVRRLVEPPLGRARHRPGDATTARLGHAAESGRRGCIDRVRATGDQDLAYALAGERVARVGGAAAERACPRLSAVGRLVDADAGDAAGTADVRLARADIDGLAGRVIRVDRDRAGRVDPSGPPRYSQCGVPARLFLAVQIPPPAGVMSAGRPPAYVSAIAIEVVRRPRRAFGTYRNEFRNGESGPAPARSRRSPTSLCFPCPPGTRALRGCECVPGSLHLGERDRGLREGSLGERGVGRAARPVVAHALVAWSCLLQVRICAAVARHSASTSDPAGAAPFRTSAENPTIIAEARTPAAIDQRLSVRRCILPSPCRCRRRPRTRCSRRGFAPAGERARR